MRKIYLLTVVITFIIFSSFVSDFGILAYSLPNLNTNNTDSINSQLAENIVVTVNVEKELFPVIAKFLSEGNEHHSISGLVKWDIQNNNSKAVHLSIISEINNWSSPVITPLDLNPNENKELFQTPFGVELLNNQTLVPATTLLEVKIGDKTIFEETRNVKIRPADDMIWSLHSPWDTESLIAAWVTPNDDVVEQVLSIAKERLYNRSLSGYRSSDLMKEIRAIFNSVRKSKVSYVDSHMSFGEVGFTQRVRLPRESILQKSANCIDGAVLFASLFENIGLEPLIVLIPGHAFVGVRLASNSRETLFIETTTVGRNMMESILTLTKTFDAAVNKALEEYNNAMQQYPNDVRIIDIKNAREMGINPLW